MIHPEKYLSAVCELVRDVARREVMGRFLSVDYERKHDGTLMTEADLAAQNALVEGLSRIVPFPVMGEEMTREEQQRLWQAGGSGLWVLDPIDGTTNFLHGLPYFASSVALLVHGRPVLGVTYNPVTDELFHAVRGGGAFLNGQRLPLKGFTPRMPDAIAGVEIKWLSGKLPARLMSVAPYGSQRNLGASTLDWCFLAAGRFDLYLHGGQKLWDYAAGSLILLEAGGDLCSLNHDDYWEDQVWTRSAVAALNPELFQQWKKWVIANR